MIAFNTRDLEINEHEHLVCPYCKAVLIPPPRLKILVGLGTCPNSDCQEVFWVTEEVAEQFNNKERR